MTQRPPRTPRTDPLVPYTTLFRSVVHRFGADHQAAVLELGAIAVVEFVAVAMALADHVGAIQLVGKRAGRSEEHKSELQSLMRISYAVFCLNKKKTKLIKVPNHIIKHNIQIYTYLIINKEYI